MTTPDTSAAFFEAMFQRSADPWDFAGDAYEQARYNAILKALEPGPYLRAYEPGCSVGVLTERLARICQRVDACDISPSAVAAAQQRCASLPGVAVRLGSLRDEVRYEVYDLIVLSEIGYYFDAAEWSHLLHRVVDGIEPGAALVASHWLGHSPDHVLTGDDVHDCVADQRLQHEMSQRYEDAERGGFRLDRWRRLP